MLDWIFVRLKVTRYSITKDIYNPLYTKSCNFMSDLTFVIFVRLLAIHLLTAIKQIRTEGLPNKMKMEFEALKYVRNPTDQNFFWMKLYRFGKNLSHYCLKLMSFIKSTSPEHKFWKEKI